MNEYQDKQEFTDRLRALADVFNRRLTAEALEQYWQSLEKYPAKVIWDVLTVARDEEARFPVPAVLIQRASARSGSGRGPSGAPKVTRYVQGLLDRTDCYCGNYKDPGHLLCRSCYGKLNPAHQGLVHEPYMEAGFWSAIRVLRDHFGVVRGGRRSEDNWGDAA